jgi:hypothetical protein
MNSGSMSIWSCVQQNSLGATHTQKIGPFFTTGESWTRFELQDIGQLSLALVDHPEGVSVTKSFVGVVDPFDDVVGSPPIFLHHAVVVPGRNSMKGNIWKCVLLGEDAECTFDNRNSMLSASGDAQCSEEDDGEKCLGFQSPAGFGVQFQEKPGLVAELVDDRLWNANPMEWFFKVELQWVPFKSVKALSMTLLCLPGQNLSPSLPKGYDIPLDEESFAWSSFRAGIEGRILKVKDHKHLFNGEALWFQADPSDLGLHLMVFQRTKPWDNVFLPGEVGMSSNGQVRQYIFDNLNASRQALAENERPAPSLRLQLTGNNEVIDGVAYPRSSSTRFISLPWQVKVEDHLTAVVFNPPRTQKVPSHLLHEGKLSEHFWLYLMYEDSYGRTVENQAQWGHFNPSKSWMLVSRWENLLLMMGSGYFPPQDVLSWFDKASIYMNICFALLPQSNNMILVLCSAVLMVFVSISILHFKGQKEHQLSP